MVIGVCINVIFTCTFCDMWMTEYFSSLFPHKFLTAKLQYTHNQQCTHNPNLLLNIIVIQNHSSSIYHTFYLTTTYNTESLT